MIQPNDRAALAAVFTDLDQAHPVDYPAWPNTGGTALRRQTQAKLAFRGVDADGQDKSWSYDTVLYVAEATEHNMDLPSVPGLDILSRWNWRLEIGRGVAEFTPV